MEQWKTLSDDLNLLNHIFYWIKENIIKNNNNTFYRELSGIIEIITNLLGVLKSLRVDLLNIEEKNELKNTIDNKLKTFFNSFEPIKEKLNVKNFTDIIEAENKLSILESSIKELEKNINASNSHDSLDKINLKNLPPLPNKTNYETLRNEQGSHSEYNQINLYSEDIPQENIQKEKSIIDNIIEKLNNNIARMKTENEKIFETIQYPEEKNGNMMHGEKEQKSADIEESKELNIINQFKEYINNLKNIYNDLLKLRAQISDENIDNREIIIQNIDAEILEIENFINLLHEILNNFQEDKKINTIEIKAQIIEMNTKILTDNKKITVLIKKEANNDDIMVNTGRIKKIKKSNEKGENILKKGKTKTNKTINIKKINKKTSIPEKKVQIYERFNVEEWLIWMANGGPSENEVLNKKRKENVIK